MNAFGIPGHGGSLGQCAYCGEAFLMEIFTGAKIVNFKAMGYLLAAHKACFKEHSKKTDWHDLPKGPIRDAAMRADVAFFSARYHLPISLPLL